MNESIKFRIKNFRSLKDIEIFLKPNIFLFGSNGSGKSSLLKAVSFFSNYVFNVLNYNLLYTDPYVYLVKSALKLNEYSIFNSYGDIVNNNDTSKKIEFITTVFNQETIIRKLSDIPKSVFIDQIVLSAEEIDYLIKFTKDNAKSKPDLDIFSTDYSQKSTEPINYRISFIFGNSKHDYDLLERICFEDIDEKFTFSFIPKLISSEVNMYPHLESQVDFSEEIEGSYLIKEFLESHLSIIPLFKLTDWDSINRNIVEKDIIREINSYFARKERNPGDDYFNHLSDIDKKLLYEKILRISDKLFIHIPIKINSVFSSLVYVPSIRELPKNSYQLSGGRFSEGDYLGIPKRLHEDLFRPTLKEEINKTFKDHFNLAENIDLLMEELSGCIITRNISNGSISNLSNASSGVQQLLPIVCFLLDDHPNSLFLCEQPELHLHPKLQTLLASFLVKKYKWSKVKIIETHSEHIIRKIQVLIAENELRKDDLAVYYFNKDEKSGTTSIKEFELEDNGFFKEPWPNGFFDDASDLAYSLLEAQIRRNN